ncbi:MAG: DUF3883 domain-containing protein [Alphaproteobacteria bacterium]|nr:DUF3883 domain-containing protein [Alphaproteobacteria bacterium]
MMISVGLLYDAQKLLATVQDTDMTAADLQKSFAKLEVAKFASVLSVAQQCQWLEVNHLDILALSANGRKIHDLHDPALQLRHQLRDILSWTSPSWAKKIADGRSEALSKMPDDVRQIFDEAGLLAEMTLELKTWWDSIGLAARNRRGEANMLTGNTAEKMTLDFEAERTGQKPKWMSAESNYAGYDILSIVGPEEPRPCPIEVKGTTLRAKEAFFTLSRNEWSAAHGNPDYRVHLWLVRDGKPSPTDQLRVVTSDQLAAHIPTNNGDGKWETVRVAFSVFW